MQRKIIIEKNIKKKKKKNVVEINTPIYLNIFKYLLFNKKSFLSSLLNKYSNIIIHVVIVIKIKIIETKILSTIKLTNQS